MPRGVIEGCATLCWEEGNGRDRLGLARPLGLWPGGFLVSGRHAARLRRVFAERVPPRRRDSPRARASARSGRSQPHAGNVARGDPGRFPGKRGRTRRARKNARTRCEVRDEPLRGCARSRSTRLTFGIGVFAPCSRDAFVAALERARTIRLAAYILRSGRLLDALETAAQRGARVRVDLEGEPYARDTAMRARLHALNCASAAALRERGARVDVHDASDAPLHVKAAVLDGALFLDDRNWPQDEADTIVRTTTRADVARVRSALDGKPRSGRSLATRKDAALALEAQTIRSAGADRIECESESFAPSPVSRALLEQARRGARVRLLICERDLAGGNKRGALTALRALAMAGAEIR